MEPIKRSRKVDEYFEISQGFEVAEKIRPSGNDLEWQARASTPEEQETAVAEPKSTEEFNFEQDKKSGNISNNDNDAGQLHECATCWVLKIYSVWIRRTDNPKSGMKK